ncbi:MAG TPA: hypothetical protein VMM84_03450 [Pyrinomonadaceae bacterium]|nr:hypothetical protein [Pyrinomonadaceae bacterium]
MSNEEFDRRIAFLLEHHAKFASDIQHLREVQAHFQETQAQTEQVVARLAHATLVGFKDTNTKIGALVDSQIRTDDALKEMGLKIDSLVDSQIRTDNGLKEVGLKINSLVDSQILTAESLQKLIAVVDRYFRKGSNGH